MKPYNPKNIPLAISLRKKMTPWESCLWYRFLRTYPVRFQRQKAMGESIADFYCAKAHLVIELDGGGHYEPDGIEYDRWRDAYIAAQGIHILRFTNTQVDREFQAVCETIDRAVTPSVSFADSSPARGEP